MVAYGPILEEAATTDEHRKGRNRVGAIEKALVAALSAAGYSVVNSVHCRIKLDTDAFVGVRAAFAGRFPKLA